MILKSLIKNPILSIGLLFFSIYLLVLGRQGKLPWPSKKINASSCYSATRMLEKRVPATWDIECDADNLTVVIQTELKVAEAKNLKAALYRELANHLIFISKNTLNESLERTLMVRVHMVHPVMEINALTEGQYIAKLAYMKKPEFIANHLKATVQVQDKTK